MKNCNDHFVFDFADAVVIRESAGDIRVGEVRAPKGGESPSVTARLDGDKLALDFVIPFMFVDNEVSDTSTNAISNSAIKKYVDGKCPGLTKIYANAAGRFDFTEAGCFADYDVLVCCMNASPVSQITAFAVPIRYVRDVNENLNIMVSDQECYTVFTFNNDGCTCKSYTGMNAGRIYAIYGIKF